jgi:predicted nucleic acid-binding protein
VWIVDTCILIDIADADPEFGAASARCLATHGEQGLLISPITYVELAPAFDGSPRLLDTFLQGLGISGDATFGLMDRAVAFRAWAQHISRRRAGGVSRRPVADALIGALAVRHKGIITRNGGDFRSFYPDLALIAP